MVKLPARVADKREQKKVKLAMEAKELMPEDCDLITRIMKNKNGRTVFTIPNEETSHVLLSLPPLRSFYNTISQITEVPASA